MPHIYPAAASSPSSSSSSSASLAFVPLAATLSLPPLPPQGALAAKASAPRPSVTVLTLGSIAVAIATALSALSRSLSTGCTWGWLAHLLHFLHQHALHIIIIVRVGHRTSPKRSRALHSQVARVRRGQCVHQCIWSPLLITLRLAMTSSRGDVSGALTRLDEVDRLRSLYARVLALQRERAATPGRMQSLYGRFARDNQGCQFECKCARLYLLREALKRNPSYQATERSLLTVPPGAATVPHREAVYAKLAELDAAISTLRTIAAAEPGHRVASSSSSAGTSSSQDMPPSKARKLAHQSISVHGSGESEACPHGVATISEMARTEPRGRRATSCH